MSDTGQAILRKEVPLTLHPLKRPRTLTEQAADAIRARIEHLLARGTLPEADPGYHSYPWPLV